MGPPQIRRFDLLQPVDMTDGSCAFTELHPGLSSEALFSGRNLGEINLLARRRSHDRGGRPVRGSSRARISTLVLAVDMQPTVDTFCCNGAVSMQRRILVNSVEQRLKPYLRVPSFH